MFPVSHLTRPPPEAFKSQILQMVVDYLSDISSLAIMPGNALYNLYQYSIGYEVHLYMEAMAGDKALNVELLIAHDPDDPEVVVGFTLYLPAVEDPHACSIAYMAVRTEYRRQGVARLMIDKVAERYAQVELNCVIAKVPWFEALGLQVIGTKGPHVCMNSQGRAIEGHIAVLDAAPIYESLEVRQIHAYLLKQHGGEAMIEAEKKRDAHLDQMTRQTATFVRDRLPPAI